MNRFKINNLDYTIEEVDEINKDNDNNQYLGLIDYVKQKILIVKNLSKEQKKEHIKT